tara:strand:+ start:270 stop:434 length:165 start_codon:yes stop_codon:yes gene_type:complete
MAYIVDENVVKDPFIVTNMVYINILDKFNKTKSELVNKVLKEAISVWGMCNKLR